MSESDPDDELRLMWKHVNSWGAVLILVVALELILGVIMIVRFNTGEPIEEQVKDVTQGCERKTRQGYDHCVYRLPF